MINTQLINSDCLAAMKNMGDNSVDAIVTDPPYGINFMQSKWDYDVPSKEIWVEALRVLKPGGHLLSFSGSRTYHRMVVNIEDAGFEIRDQIMWIYGSGFPKSLNISKAIDKAAGAEREVIGIGRSGAPETHSSSYNMSKGGSQQMGGEYEITKPTTSEAEQWDGWGTALKPAHEPIVLARKPLIRTVAENVLEHGTGAINVDGCRITYDKESFERNQKASQRPPKEHEKAVWKDTGHKERRDVFSSTGRFPANVILDEEAGAILDEQTGELSAGHAPKLSKGNPFSGVNDTERKEIHFGKGGASRFFYCAKPSQKERNGGVDNNHPTVKPVDLMRYLCRLITPPAGIILDPFMGSGTTGIAANLEGFNFIGIEMEEEYVEVARARISHSGDYTIAEDLVMKRIKQPTLFDFAI